jgi:hypothetical protein
MKLWFFALLWPVGMWVDQRIMDRFLYGTQNIEYVDLYESWTIRSLL